MFVVFFCLCKDLDQQKYIYTKGCVGQFEKWLQDNLIVVAGIFVGIALLQVSSPLLLFILLPGIYTRRQGASPENFNLKPTVLLCCDFG